MSPRFNCVTTGVCGLPLNFFASEVFQFSACEVFAHE